MTRPIFVAALLATAIPSAALPSAALAQSAPAPTIRQADAERLANLDAATGTALRQLVVEGDAAQLALARLALTGLAQPAEDVAAADLTGDWKCSMTKIGGLLPAVGYPPFRCRIAADVGRLTFDKLTGSQRTRGTLQLADGRWVHLGSTFVAGEQPMDYADFPEVVDTSAGETLPDVGVFEVTGPDSARILFPQPYRESILNVLTLTR